MLGAFKNEYHVLDEGMRGPDKDDDAPKAVLGKNGQPESYGADWADDFEWYRYLFLGRGKPATHIRVLSKVTDDRLKSGAPECLTALLSHVVDAIGLDGDEEADA